MMGIGVLEGELWAGAGAGEGAGSAAATAGGGSWGLANATRNCDGRRTQANTYKKDEILNSSVHLCVFHP